MAARCSAKRFLYKRLRHCPPSCPSPLAALRPCSLDRFTNSFWIGHGDSPRQYVDGTIDFLGDSSTAGGPYGVQIRALRARAMPCLAAHRYDVGCYFRLLTGSVARPSCVTTVAHTCRNPCLSPAKADGISAVRAINDPILVRPLITLR